MYGLVHTFWLTHYNPPESASAIAVAMTIDFTPFACGYFMSVCSSVELSSIFGERHYEKASQVLADLLRFAFVLGLLVPAVFLAIARPLMDWVVTDMDNKSYIIDQAFNYLIFSLSAAPITCIYLTLCGCLEAEGRTFLFGFAHLSSMILSSAVFDPLLIIVADLGVRGPGVAMILAQFIPAVFLLVFFLRGKFTVKLRFRDLFKRPVSESWHAISLGLPSLASSISNSIPIIFFEKYLQETVDVNDSAMYLQLYNAFSRLYAVALALYLGVCMGLLASGSFAYGGMNMVRLIKLVFHAWWLLAAIGGTIALLIDALPKEIASIFVHKDDSDREAFLNAFEKCCRQYWTTTALMAWIYLGPSVLQVMNRPALALLCSFLVQICWFPVISTIMFHTGRGAPHLFWSGCANDTSGVVLTLLFNIPSIRELRNRRFEAGPTTQSVTDIVPDCPLLPANSPDEELSLPYSASMD
jgi:Na+-driven multidrug efflux pump